MVANDLAVLNITTNSCSLSYLKLCHFKYRRDVAGLI